MTSPLHTLDELARRLAAAVPDEVKQAGAGLEAQFKTILEGAVARLDLVTREEFEAQKKVLARSTQKLAELEAKLKALSP